MKKTLKPISIIYLAITFGCVSHSEKAQSDTCYSTVGIFIPKEMNNEIEKYLLDSTDVGESIKRGGLKNEDVKLKSTIKFIVNNLEDNHYLVNALFWSSYYDNNSGAAYQLTFKYDKKTNTIVDYSRTEDEGGKYIDTLLGKKYQNNAEESSCDIQ